MAIFIDIEGTDGSGKQTQTTLLTENLNRLGYDCFRQDFPNYNSPSSSLVKMFLRGDFGNSAYSLDPYQISSFYAVDRLSTIKLLEPRLEEKTIVVLDRYTYSNVIHNATKIADHDERDRCINWIEDHEFNVLKLPRPKIVIFLDMPPQKSQELTLKRANKNGEIKDVFEQDRAYQLNAYTISKKISQERGWTEISCIDDEGNIKPIDKIQDEILNIVKDVIDKS